MEVLSEGVDYGVIGFLIALSLWAVVVSVERWLFYKRVDLSLSGLADPRDLRLVTIAANAPYIGLLGTVLGIMLTFHTMGNSGNMAVNTIMIGLSLALKATAAGLIVAIPCVVMNNVLRRRVSELTILYKGQHGT
jgi:biopolymer transport protein ExbB